MSAAKPPSASAGKKRGLGRGLEALLGPKAAAEAPLLEATPQDALRSLPIDALAPGKYQPRRTMDDAKLAEYEGYALKALKAGEDALAREVAAKIALLEIERDGEAVRVKEFAEGVAQLRATAARFEATIQRLNSAVRPKNPSPAATAVRSANRKALRTRAPFPAPKL